MIGIRLKSLEYITQKHILLITEDQKISKNFKKLNEVIPKLFS